MKRSLNLPSAFDDPRSKFTEEISCLNVSESFIRFDIQLHKSICDYKLNFCYNVLQIFILQINLNNLMAIETIQLILRINISEFVFIVSTRIMSSLPGKTSNCSSEWPSQWWNIIFFY
jgi:hypothetical protein